MTAADVKRNSKSQKCVEKPASPRTVFSPKKKRKVKNSGKRVAAGPGSKKLEQLQGVKHGEEIRAEGKIAKLFSNKGWKENRVRAGGEQSDKLKKLHVTSGGRSGEKSKMELWRTIWRIGRTGELLG